MKKHPDNPLIAPSDVVPSNSQLLVKGALNPGAVQYGDKTILLLRVAEGCKPQPGTVAVPLYRFENGKGNLEILRLDPLLVASFAAARFFQVR